MPQADVFQQIQSQFERKSPRPFCHGSRTKVLARNDVHFISDLPDKWLVDYERRQGHRHSGFFAYNHLPYKTFGNLKHTDVYDLIGEQLDIAIPKHHAYSHAFSRHHFIKDHEEDCSNAYDPQLMIKVVRLSSQHKSLPHSRNAGLSSLRLALGANERSTREMNAGSAFRDVLRREDERNIFLQDIRAPKVVKGSRGQSCLVYNPSLFLPPMVHTASSKACLTLSDAFHKKPPHTQTCQGGGEGGGGGNGGNGGVQVHEGCKEGREGVEGGGNREGAASRTVGVGPNLYVALAAAQFKLHHAAHLKVQDHKMQTSNSLRHHHQRQCLAKVKSVYAILCCLHNIRMRDLRAKEPLTAAVISAISQRPLHSLTKDTHDAHHHHPHLHMHTPGGHHSRYDTHTPTFHHHHPSQHHHHPSQHHHHLHQSHHQPSVVHHGGLIAHEQSLDGANRLHHHSHTHHTKHLTHLTPHYKPHTHTISRHVKIQTENHIETWEDILSIDAGAGLHANLSHTPHPPQQLHSTATLHHHHGYGGVHHKPNRSLPPWQRQVVYVDTEDDNRRRCPKKQIHDCVDAFQQCKNLLAHNMTTTLIARKPNLQKYLVAKLQALPLRQGGGSVEECLEEMRERAYQAGREERAGEEMKPAWYAQLEKEVCGVFDLQKDEEGRGALERLHQFLCVDNDAIPHAIEKLCLLMMSLPANQVCYQPFVSAIQFVLEHVLKAPPQLYSQWLDLRQLPKVTTELPQQAYLFGMPV